MGDQTGGMPSMRQGRSADNKAGTEALRNQTAPTYLGMSSLLCPHIEDGYPIANQIRGLSSIYQLSDSLPIP
jgi:hypothetical protein